MLTHLLSGFGLEGILYNQFDIDNDIRQGTTSSESPRHRKTRSDDSDEEGSGSSKRTKRGHNRRGRDHSSDDTPVATSRRTRELEIGNSKDVKDFYTTRFKDMQQTACKTIGKAFVKLVEPKKQTHHPYTKGDALAPPWWPSDKHLGEEYVRHKEPDHLYKKGWCWYWFSRCWLSLTSTVRKDCTSSPYSPHDCPAPSEATSICSEGCFDGAKAGRSHK